VAKKKREKEKATSMQGPLGPPSICPIGSITKKGTKGRKDGSHIE
jgi:hypothetical protein